MKKSYYFQRLKAYLNIYLRRFFFLFHHSTDLLYRYNIFFFLKRHHSRLTVLPYKLKMLNKQHYFSDCTTPYLMAQ